MALSDYIVPAGTIISYVDPAAPVTTPPTYAVLKGTGNAPVPTGEPITPPVMKEYHDELITVKFRSTQIDFDGIKLCRGNVNTAAVTMNIRGQNRTFAPGTLRFLKNTYETAFEPAGFSVWQQSYLFLLREDGWLVKVQPVSMHHKGFSGLYPNRYDHSSSTENSIFLSAIIPTPKYLNAAGTDWLEDGTALPPPLSFRNSKSVDFTTFLTGITVVL